MIRKQLKIAIYSGVIPSTTFIEELIQGLSKHHKVFLFGRIGSSYSKFNNNIYIFGSGNSNIINVLQVCIRTIGLGIRFPKRLKLLWLQLVKQDSWYKKRKAWIRITPILLNLPDVFHVQWAKETSQWLFLQELSVKVVVSLRGAHINYSPIANKALAKSYKDSFPKVDAFHAVSRAMALEVQKYGVSNEKIEIIHSLIPRSTFNLFRTPKKSDSNKVLKILSVGRHHWKKGYTTALDTCKLLKNKGFVFKYTIIAGDRVPEELLYQINELNLKKEVEFKHALRQMEVFKEMQMNDVLLLPSYEEGIANVVLEAMAIGLPIVSADCGGMAEVVFPNMTGWLVPILDPSKMVEALIEVAELSIDKKKEITQRTYEFVKENFEEEKGIGSFLDLYDSL